MEVPEIPRNEEQRLEALQGLTILDTTADPQLDFITKIVKERFAVPIVLISLVDRNRQWFKSKQGISANETPRDISFCGHAILQQDIFIVNNALEDFRFRDNPLVLGPPHIRFYAGAPLSTADQYQIGTLCIIDTKPRKFNQSEKIELKSFASLIKDQLNKSDQQYHASSLLDHALDGLFELDADERFVFINLFGANLLGYTKEELLGQKIDVILPKKRFDGSHYVRDRFGGVHAIKTKKMQEGDEDLLKKDGQIIHASCHFHPIVKSNKVSHVLMSFRDNFERDSLVTELEWQKSSLEKIINARISSLGLRGKRQKPRSTT
jgi:PAS domain S-box-containing protein